MRRTIRSKGRMALASLLGALAFGAFAQESPIYVETISCLSGPFGMTLPTDARKVRAMAPLVREAVLEVERWDGYTATRKTLYFDGLELGVIEFSNDPARLMVTYAEVNSPRWNRLLPFKLHQATSSARRLLGEHAKGDEPLKRSYAGESDSVQFRTSEGKVVGVSYHCYSG